MRAGTIPSWSRYFATVRLAIFTPSLFSRFTIAWSVRGRRGSSLSTRLWIFACTPRVEMSEPVTVGSPPEKKYLSG